MLAAGGADDVDGAGGVAGDDAAAAASAAAASEPSPQAQHLGSRSAPTPVSTLVNMFFRIFQKQIQQIFDSNSWISVTVAVFSNGILTMICEIPTRFHGFLPKNMHISVLANCTKFPWFMRILRTVSSFHGSCEASSAASSAVSSAGSCADSCAAKEAEPLGFLEESAKYLNAKERFQNSEKTKWGSEFVHFKRRKSEISSSCCDFAYALRIFDFIQPRYEGKKFPTVTSTLT